MPISINKLESSNVIHNKDFILTPLYGKIKIAQKVNMDEYTYFDTVDNFDLFVDESGDNTVAIKIESVSNESNFITKDIDNIQQKYNVETVKYDDTTPAIIVKVSENNIDTIQQIINDYKDNNNYTLNHITSQVLFLEPTNNDIQLEEDNFLNKLSDDAVKKIATDLGADNNDTKNKDSAVGYIKGKLSNNN